MKTISVLLFLTVTASSALAQQGESLNTIIERALVIHPRVLEAKAALAGELARRGETLSPYRPMVSLNGYFVGGDGSMVFASSVKPINWAHTQRDGVAIGNVMLMWRVWTGGRDATARDLSAVRIEAARHILTTVEQDVALGVRLSYSEYDYRKGLLESEKVNAKAAQETERNAAQREAAGKAPKAFVLRAAAEARKAERQVAVAGAAATTALAKLVEAAGGHADVTETSLQANLEGPESLAAALVRSGQRTELAFFETMAEAQGLEAKMVRQSLRPEVAFMAMGSVLGSSFMDTGNRAKFGLIVSFPLSDGGSRSAKAKRLDANAERFMAQMEQMRLTVRREVESAWAEWKSSDAVLESSLAGLESATESYGVEKLRFENGKSILAELLDAQSMLSEARAEVLSAMRYRDAAWSKLMRAMGEAPETLMSLQLAEAGSKAEGPTDPNQSELRI